MRQAMRPLVLPGMSLVLVAIAFPLSAAAPLPNGVYTDGSAAGPATVTWNGPCNGQGTLTVAVTNLLGQPEVRTSSVESLMVPDLCLIACLECPLPFVWTLTNKADGVELSGGGVVPGEASLQGTFQGGVLEIRAGLV